MLMNIGGVVSFTILLILVVVGFLLSFYLLRHKR